MTAREKGERSRSGEPETQTPHFADLFQGLASGYLRLPQETKTRFIKTPEARRGLGGLGL